MKKEADNIVHIRPVVPIDSNQEQVRVENKKKYKKIIIVGLILLSVLGITLGVYVNITTFTDTSLTTAYSDVSVMNSSCVDFIDGFLKYGKDGATYIDFNGEAVWNHPYEISSPIVVTTDVSAVIADSGGNQVVVVDKDGVKGEFETYLPIEKVTVSQQGVVAVLMNDGTTSQIICYDAVGNILAEHKSTLTGKGYPTALALSDDGQILLVSYLQVGEDGITSNYVYYSFGNTEQVTEDIIASGTKENVVIPEVKFLTSEVSVVINEQSMEIYKGTESIELQCEVVFEDEVESVFYGDKEIGFIFKSSNNDTKELRVYNTSGEVKLSIEITGEYESVDIINNQIVLYEKEHCLIYSLQGIEKFNGEMGMELTGVFPMLGINKYVIVGDEGMQKVRLVR